MKVVVLGLWHLGCVIAACSAKFAEVVGLDFSEETVLSLRVGKAPLFEPGLDPLIREGLLQRALSFETDPGPICQEADILWVAYDTPVDDDDRADLTPVLTGIARCHPFLAERAIVLISSQIPAGTCRSLEAKYPRRRFAYTPENLRLGRAIEIFLKPDRIILGARSSEDAAYVGAFLKNFSTNILVVSPESAEVIKHGINAFLAISITFMNELSRICEAIGADAREVEKGLKSERRIGPGAYLSPGGPFAGGTLARDVVALTDLAEKQEEELILIPAIKLSNDRHKSWAFQKLKEELGTLRNQIVTILGLTYKVNTDTLRRSLAIELCRLLQIEGVEIRAFDPVVKALPDDLENVSLFRNIEEATQGSDAVVVCTEWPELLEVPWPLTMLALRHAIVIDASGFLSSKVGRIPGVRYRCVGKPRMP